MQIEVESTDAPSRKPQGDLGFGRILTDHVFQMDYDVERGWHGARVVPYAPLRIEPAASALHYGQSVFEGLKAFRGDDGKVRLFRPERHAARFRRSCERLCIPPIDEDVFLEAVGRVVKQDVSWVPEEEGAALYIRPLVFATEPFLGVRPAKTYTFLVLLSPVGAYYKRGFSPVRIWVEREAVRAAKGGVGAAKTAGNYAASLRITQSAMERGYDQVLWTDAAEHRWLEEVGTMNLFVHLGAEVVTPPLDGCILPGVTRDSVIRLLQERGVPIVERPISVDEVRQAHADGELREVFGTGTAAVVSPVGWLGFEDGDLEIGGGEVGPLARALFDDVVGIQRGRVEDRFGWTRIVE